MKICGIYLITNTINGKVYIGQAVDIEKRWKRYDRGDFTNLHIKNAVIKYGWDNFTKEIICECDNSKLTEMENFYIDSFMSNNELHGYNKRTQDENSKCVMSRDSILRISKTQRNRYADNPQLLEIVSKNSLEMWKNPEHIKMKSDMTKKQWEDADYRNRQLHILEKTRNDPNVRKRVSDKIKEKWNDPVYRDKGSGMNTYNAKPIWVMNTKTGEKFYGANVTMGKRYGYNSTHMRITGKSKGWVRLEQVLTSEGVFLV